MKKKPNPLWLPAAEIKPSRIDRDLSKLDESRPHSRGSKQSKQKLTNKKWSRRRSSRRRRFRWRSQGEEEEVVWVWVRVTYGVFAISPDSRPQDIHFI